MIKDDEKTVAGATPQDDGKAVAQVEQPGAPGATQEQKGQAANVSTQSTTQGATNVSAQNTTQSAAATRGVAQGTTQSLKGDDGGVNVLNAEEEDDGGDFQATLARMRQKAEEARQKAAAIDTAASPSKVNWREELARVRNEYLESDDARARREKRERARRKMAAITDGIVALANIGGAMGGATPLKQTSLSAAQKAEADKAKERRRRDKAAYEMAYRHIAARKDADDRQRAAYAAKRAALKKDYEQQADKIDVEVLKAQRAADALAETKRHNLASEGTARIRANKAGRTSNGGGKKPYGTYNGVTYDTKADYDKAVRKDAGVLKTTTEDTDLLGKKKQRPMAAVAAENETKIEKQSKSKNTKNLAKKRGL